MVPLGLVMSSDHYAHELALKSPKIIENCDFEKRTLLSISSMPERKDSNSTML